MLEALKDIDHVNFVRIGTRTPVVYPLRYFDDELIKVLHDFNQHKTLYIPTHFNHANEITDLAKEAILRIRNAGITVNNQAVFLKGVNDSVEALTNGLTRIEANPLLPLPVHARFTSTPSALSLSWVMTLEKSKSADVRTIFW